MSSLRESPAWKSWEPRVRIPLGFKFLSLLVFILLGVVGSIVWNATELFKKDNLNSILISTDMLTQAKASEFHFWLDSLEKRTSAADQSEAVLGADREILGVAFKSHTRVGKTGLAELGLSPADVIQALDANSKIRVPKMIRIVGRIYGLAVPLKTGLALVRLENLRQIFRNDGPFQLAAITQDGQWILPPVHQDLSSGEAGAIPLIANLKTTQLERQFIEFGWKGQNWLGAFARVASHPLAVVSFVPKQVAFESGDILVERSFSIALFALSLSAILAYVFVLQLTVPLQKLKQAAIAIARGDFGTQVQIQTRDETLDLAKSFNLMGAEIAAKIQNLARLNTASQTLGSQLDPTLLLTESARFVQEITRTNRSLGMFKGTTGGVILSKQNWYSDQELPIKTLLTELRSIKAPQIVSIQDYLLLVAPLKEGKKAAGFLVFADRQDGKPLSEENLSVLGTLSSSTNATFAIIQLLRETADKARMERELETAKLVQDTMFPPPLIQQGNWSIAGFYTPAGECGGDWWGSIAAPNGDLVLAIGDATGHGVPAALITATARASFSILEGAAASQPLLLKAPELVLQLLNRAVYDSSRGKIMMTFFVAYLESATGKIRYASASHDPVYWHHHIPGSTQGSKDQMAILEVNPGPRLGQEAQANYSVGEATLAAGDTLYLYTDGIPEGVDSSGKEYGDRKFLRSLAKHAVKPSAQARDGVIQDFRDFTAGAKLLDDVTLITVRFKPD